MCTSNRELAEQRLEGNVVTTGCSWICEAEETWPWSLNNQHATAAAQTQGLSQQREKTKGENWGFCPQQFWHPSNKYSECLTCTPETLIKPMWVAKLDLVVSLFLSVVGSQSQRSRCSFTSSPETCHMAGHQHKVSSLRHCSGNSEAALSTTLPVWRQYWCAVCELYVVDSVASSLLLKYVKTN